MNKRKPILLQYFKENRDEIIKTGRSRGYRHEVLKKMKAIHNKVSKLKFQGISESLIFNDYEYSGEVNMKSRISKFLLYIFIFVGLFLSMEFRPYIDPNSRYDTTTMNKVIILYNNYKDNPVPYIAKEEDLNTLKEIFGTGFGISERPRCPFGNVALIFSSDNSEFILYPSADDCDSILFKSNGLDYYFQIGNNNKRKLCEILLNYGIVP